MPAPARDLTNILQGRANFYLAPMDTAQPADTIAFDEAWLSPWVFGGVSEKGLDLLVDTKEKEHYVDDYQQPVLISVDKKTFAIQFSFAEDTMENFRYATGGGTITTQAAGTGTIGKKSLALSEDLETIAVGFEVKNKHGFFKRVIIPKVVSVGKIKASHTRTKDNRVYAAEFRSICPISEIKIYEKTANATA